MFTLSNIGRVRKASKIDVLKTDFVATELIFKNRFSNLVVAGAYRQYQYHYDYHYRIGESLANYP